MNVDPVALFHLVELYMTEKLGYQSFSAVDTNFMVDGYLLSYGVKDGKAQPARITRDELEVFVQELKLREEASASADAKSE